MKLLSIGKLDKNIIFPIAGGILKFILTIILDIDKFTLSTHPLIFSICASMGMCLSYFLFIIYKYKNANQKNIIEKNNKENNCKKKKSLIIKLEYNDQLKDITYNKFKYIILTSLLDFILTILAVCFYSGTEVNFWIFDILFICLFSYFIFKIKIYKHHIISIILIIFTGIILDIIKNIHLNAIKNGLTQFIIKFVGEIFFSLLIIIVQYTMEKKFCSSYELCFYEGIITFVLYTILLLISTFCNLNLDNFKDYFDSFNIKELFIFLGFMILLFGFNILQFLTIEKNTAYHFMIIKIIGELFPYIKNFTDNKLISAIIIIGLFFILFMTLVFNETIEINCCDMQKNTKKNIALRAALESKEINIYDDNYEDSQNTSESDFSIDDNGTGINDMNIIEEN